MSRILSMWPSVPTIVAGIRLGTQSHPELLSNSNGPLADERMECATLLGLPVFFPKLRQVLGRIDPFFAKAALAAHDAGDFDRAKDRGPHRYVVATAECPRLAWDAKKIASTALRACIG